MNETTYTGRPVTAPRPGTDRLATREEARSAAEEDLRAQLETTYAPDYTAEPELKPICVALHAQEIGAMTRLRVSPTEFAQTLLGEFRKAGAPVEGMVKLRLAHGSVYKMKAHPFGRAWFGYLWVPEELDRRLAAWRKANLAPQEARVELEANAVGGR